MILLGLPADRRPSTNPDRIRREVVPSTLPAQQEGRGCREPKAASRDKDGLPAIGKIHTLVLPPAASPWKCPYLLYVEPRRLEALSWKDGTILCQHLITVKMPAIVVLPILAHFLGFQRFVLTVCGERLR
jgi:hypothetical protein